MLSRSVLRGGGDSDSLQLLHLSSLLGDSATSEGVLGRLRARAILNAATRALGDPFPGAWMALTQDRTTELHLSRVSFLWPKPLIRLELSVWRATHAPRNAHGCALRLP